MSIKYHLLDFTQSTQFYNELGENITENLFKNQSALFLAYGSSGSGKTYTTVGTARYKIIFIAEF